MIKKATQAMYVGTHIPLVGGHPQTPEKNCPAVFLQYLYYSYITNIIF